MCTPETLQRVLDETAAELGSIFGEKLADVILYGSYARGDADEESDVDIMALIRDVPREGLRDYQGAVSRAASGIGLRNGVLVSIILEDVPTFERYGNFMVFFKNVTREGISVVRRGVR